MARFSFRCSEAAAISFESIYDQYFMIMRVTNLVLTQPHTVAPICNDMSEGGRDNVLHGLVRPNQPF